MGRRIEVACNDVCAIFFGDFPELAQQLLGNVAPLHCRLFRCAGPEGTSGRRRPESTCPGFLPGSLLPLVRRCSYNREQVGLSPGKFKIVVPRLFRSPLHSASPSKFLTLFICLSFGRGRLSAFTIKAVFHPSAGSRIFGGSGRPRGALSGSIPSFSVSSDSHDSAGVSRVPFFENDSLGRLREGQLFEHFFVFAWYFFSPSFALPAPSRHAVQRTLSHAQAEETVVQRKATD